LFRPHFFDVCNLKNIRVSFMTEAKNLIGKIKKTTIFFNN